MVSKNFCKLNSPLKNLVYAPVDVYYKPQVTAPYFVSSWLHV